MKKNFLFTLLVLGSCFCANAQSGYHANVEVGGIVGVSDYGDNGFSVLTSHGFMLNSSLFLGIGVGYEYYMGWDVYSVPVYANAKYYFLNGRWSPFIDAKIGYSCSGALGLYANPSIGVRYAFNDKYGVTVSAGYNMQSETFYYVDSPGDEFRELMGGLSVKVGFEF